MVVWNTIGWGKTSLRLYNLMCLDCVRQLEPPTPQIAKARLFLQLLAGGLFITSLFALLAGQVFSIFFMMLLGFLLYMSWSEFNHDMTLNFILICTLQTLIVYVEVIGLVEYYDQVSSSKPAAVLYLIVRFIYFPNAIFFSHQAYKRFKQHAKYNSPNQSFGDYQMMPVSTPSQTIHQDLGGRRFMPFQGQATTIG